MCMRKINTHKRGKITGMRITIGKNSYILQRGNKNNKHIETKRAMIITCTLEIKITFMHIIGNNNDIICRKAITCSDSWPELIKSIKGQS